jgi:hypothetical protein
MRMRLFVVLAVAVAIGLATAVSPFASSSPDGLQRVAENHGFAGHGRDRDAPIRGYAFPGVRDQRLAKGLAGFAGTLVAFAAGWGLVTLLGRSRRRVVVP